MRTKTSAAKAGTIIIAACMVLIGCENASVLTPATESGASTGSTGGGSTSGSHTISIPSTDAGLTVRDAGGPEVDAGHAIDAGSPPDAGTVGTVVPDAGSPVPPGDVDAGPPPVDVDAGPPPVDVDAGPPPVDVDAGPPPVTDAGSTTVPTNPSFGCWAWSTPDITAVVHAGFQWFESGYPGTLTASDNQYLSQNGVLPFAYINMSEVPNSDTFIQGQVGSFWSSIKVCENTGWNTSVMDVRDSRWQDWLIRRANDAYSLGNRGIKWDVAGVESLCNGWSGVGGAAAQQQAIDAMANVLATLKATHPDFKFIVNQGFGIAQQHPEVIDGFELENMMNYSDANPGDAWAADTVAQVRAIHANAHVPILDLEYTDDFGCADTTCAYAGQLYDEIRALDWVPYITVVDMNVQGRGLGITPPW